MTNSMSPGRALMSEAPPRRWQTALEVLWLSLPSTAGYVLTTSCDVTNAIFLGRSGDQATLAAIGLCSLFVNCAGQSVGIGIAGAMDTLVSQACGAKQTELAIHILQRCRLIVALQFIWILPLLWSAGDILRMAGQDAEVSTKANSYTRIVVFGLFASMQFESIRKFLQNRGEPMAPFVICAVASVLHIGWCYLFVIHLRWSNFGAGCAMFLTWWTRFLLGSAYLARVARQEGIRLRSVLWVERPAFCEWGAFLKYGVPATVQLCSGWWFWELSGFLVGYLGKAPLAAHVATNSWVGISVMPTIGMRAATATIVGNALGANLPKRARLAAWSGVVLILGTWSITATIFVVFRRPLSAACTKDPEIQRIVQSLLQLYAAAGFADACQLVLSAALGGMGRPSLAATVYAIVYYVFMLPGGAFAAFVLEMGIYGIWCSRGVGTAAACMVFTVVLCKTNWPQLAAEASSRMQCAGSKAEELAKWAEGAQCELSAAPLAAARA